MILLPTSANLGRSDIVCRTHMDEIGRKMCSLPYKANVYWEVMGLKYRNKCSLSVVCDDKGGRGEMLTPPAHIIQLGLSNTE